jgi:hypothetical protein
VVPVAAAVVETSLQLNQPTMAIQPTELRQPVEMAHRLRAVTTVAVAVAAVAARTEVLAVESLGHLVSTRV